MVVFATIIVGGLYFLYAHVRLQQAKGQKGMNMLSLSVIICSGLILSALLRLLYFFIDPYLYWGFNHPVVDGLLFSLPFVMYFGVAMVLVLMWFEATSKFKKVRENTEGGFLHRYRRQYIALCLLALGCMLVVTIVQAAVDNWYTLLVYNIVLILFIIVMVTGKLVGSWRIYKTLRINGVRSYYSAAQTAFLKRLVAMVTASALALLGAVFIMIVYTILNAGDVPLLYILLHFSMRLAEALYLTAYIFILAQKAPERSSSNPSAVGISVQKSFSNMSEAVTKQSGTVTIVNSSTQSKDVELTSKDTESAEIPADGSQNHEEPITNE